MDAFLMSGWLRKLQVQSHSQTTIAQLNRASFVQPAAAKAEKAAWTNFFFVLGEFPIPTVGNVNPESSEETGEFSDNANHMASHMVLRYYTFNACQAVAPAGNVATGFNLNKSVLFSSIIRSRQPKSKSKTKPKSSMKPKNDTSVMSAAMDEFMDEVPLVNISKFTLSTGQNERVAKVITLSLNTGDKIVLKAKTERIARAWAKALANAGVVPEKGLARIKQRCMSRNSVGFFVRNSTNNYNSNQVPPPVGHLKAEQDSTSFQASNINSSGRFSFRPRFKALVSPRALLGRKQLPSFGSKEKSELPAILAEAMPVNGNQMLNPAPNGRHKSGNLRNLSQALVYQKNKLNLSSSQSQAFSLDHSSGHTTNFLGAHGSSRIVRSTLGSGIGSASRQESVLLDLISSVRNNSILFDSLLREFDNEGLKELTNFLKKVKCVPGDILMQKGEYQDKMTLILDGAYEVRDEVKPNTPGSTNTSEEFSIEELTQPPERKTQVTSVKLQGSCFTELALLFDTENKHLIRCQLKGIVYHLSRSHFELCLRQCRSRLEDNKLDFMHDLLLDMDPERTLGHSKFEEVSLAIKQRAFQPGTIILNSCAEAQLCLFVVEGWVEVVSKNATDSNYIRGQYIKVPAASGYTLLAGDAPTCILLIDARLVIDYVLKASLPPPAVLRRASASSFITEATTAAFEETPALMPELEFNHLIPVGHLGRGNFGKVYLMKPVKDISFPSYKPEEEQTPIRFFALKLIPRAKIAACGLQAMLNGEVNLMAEVSHLFRSPFIAKLYHSYADKRHIYLIMECCECGDLCRLYRKILQPNDSKKPQISQKRYEATVQFHTACVIEGLSVLHKHGAIYRDLKWENVLVAKDGYSKLCDFGLSKMGNRTYSVCGTPEYTAPETLTRFGHGSAVDFWALGITLFEQRTLRTPFMAESEVDIFEGIFKHQFGRNISLSYNTKKERATYKKLPSWLLKPEKTLLDLVHRLLNPAPQERLAFGNSESLRQHPYFAGFNWEALRSQTMPPPVEPVILMQCDETINKYHCIETGFYLTEEDTIEWTPDVNTILEDTPRYDLEL